MRDAQKIDEFLQLEDCEEILTYRTDNGLLIWPGIRYLVLSNLYNDKLGLEELLPSKKFGFGHVVRFLQLFIFGNPLIILLKRGVENLFIYSSVSNIKIDNRYFNRVADYFFFQTETYKSFCLETLYNKELNTPRVHGRVAYAILLNGLAKILVKFGVVRISKKEIARVECIIQLFDKRSKSRCVETLSKLKPRILEQLANSKGYFLVYNLFFSWSSVKRIFLEDAAYGGSSFITYAARKNKILVIEPQHGAITREHLGYNFASTILSSNEYKKYLPDHFLSYGEYWNEQVNLPVNKVIIGNPFLSEYLDAKHDGDQSDQQSILFISPGTTKEETELIVSKLQSHFGSRYRVKLRPHPLERSQAPLKYKGLVDSGVEIDQTPKVYDSIKQALCIIGDISTVLFEAIAFKKIVISYRSKINPAIDFPENFVVKTELEDVANTVEALLSNQNSSLTNNTSYVWESDWKSKFSQFMKSV